MAPPDGQQVPNDELTTLKAVALTRLVCPDANIPSTTALATLDPSAGRDSASARRERRHAEPDPAAYRVLYEIYPGKAAAHETAEALAAGVHGLLSRLGRTVGHGPGGRRHPAL